MESTDPRKPPCLAKRLWLEEEESHQQSLGLIQNHSSLPLWKECPEIPYEVHETKFNYNVHVDKKINLQIIHPEGPFLLQQYRQIFNFMCIHKYTYVTNNLPLNISLQSYQLAYSLGRQWSQKPCIQFEAVDFCNFSPLLINYTFLKT